MLASAGTIVFGMEDGTVASFGLVFGVAAATSDGQVVLIAGASGAAAAAVSMMAGAYLAAETDKLANPLELALWMLVADFISASVPVVPFALLPIGTARVVSATVTLAVLVLLGIGRARVSGRGLLRAVSETVAIGVAACAAGVLLGLLVSR